MEAWKNWNITVLNFTSLFHFNFPCDCSPVQWSKHVLHCGQLGSVVLWYHLAWQQVSKTLPKHREDLWFLFNGNQSPVGFSCASDSMTELKVFTAYFVDSFLLILSCRWSYPVEFHDATEVTRNISKLLHDETFIFCQYFSTAATNLFF